MLANELLLSASDSTPATQNSARSASGIRTSIERNSMLPSAIFEVRRRYSHALAATAMETTRMKKLRSALDVAVTFSSSFPLA